MSSLWTPSGERKVPRSDPFEPAPAGDGGAPPADGPPGGSDGPPRRRGPASPEEEAAIREQLAELSERISAAPPEEIVANHAFGLFELAAIHLSRQPPHLEATRLAIDGFAALVETLGDRLGGHAPSLREALSQIRLAYVQIASAAPDGDGAAGAAPAAAVAEEAEEAEEAD